MLILTRRIGESIIISKSIKITILRSAGNQVRVGIEAPQEIEVHREEIFERILEKHEKKEKEGRGQ